MGRKVSPEKKSEIALAALRETDTIAALSTRYGVHANVIYKWKRELVNNASVVFETKQSSSNEVDHEAREAELLKKIGELTMERDFLSKGLALPKKAASDD